MRQVKFGLSLAGLRHPLANPLASPVQAIVACPVPPTRATACNGANESTTPDGFDEANKPCVRAVRHDNPNRGRELHFDRGGPGCTFLATSSVDAPRRA
jgi:hypothetical protein